MQSLESFVQPVPPCNVCGQSSKHVGVPCRCRWTAWTAAVQLWEQREPRRYEDLLLDAGPEDRQIDLDIGRTFPHLVAFDAVKERSLGRLLRAYVAFRPDVGYCQGMNFVAGLLVLAADEEEEDDAFRVFLRLMDTYNLAGFYRQGFPLLRRYVDAADRLLLHETPSLHGHLMEQGVQPFLYMHEWFLSLFVDCLPPALVLDIFDAITEKGLYIVIPIVVSILRSLQDTILSQQFEGIFRCLKALKSPEDPCAAKLKNVVHCAYATKVPNAILAYVSGDADEIAEIPVEAEPNSKSLIGALSRAFSSLSPKKRRMRRAQALEAEVSVQASPASNTSSPKKRFSFKAASPCSISPPRLSQGEAFEAATSSPKKRFSFKAASPSSISSPRLSQGEVFEATTLLPSSRPQPGEELFSAISRSSVTSAGSAPGSPSKWARWRRRQESTGPAQLVFERQTDMAEEANPNQMCARQRQAPRPKPQQLILDDEQTAHDCDVAAAASKAELRVTCGGIHDVASPARSRCPSSSSPSKRDCSGSPKKSSSPVKKSALWMRANLKI